MNTCQEFFSEQYRIDFYLSDGVQGDGPGVIVRKAIDASLISVNEEQRLFSVGRYAAHDDTHFRSNDTNSEITTSVSESVEDFSSTVSLHFEFQKPTLNMLNLCDKLAYTPFVVLLHYLGPDGSPAATRLIRPANAVAAKVEITEDKGVTSVDVEIYSVNGIQQLLD
jgi:hypothetical protein